jgi:predicted ATPase/class 3 adenylate cyclase
MGSSDAMSTAPRDDAVAIPRGTITFVFSDVEGSTQRWDRNRPAMETAVRRHDALMREAIAAHGGHVFKTIGDAFCAAFSRPEDAVAAMLDAQQALAAEDFTAVDGLRVRVAIHTGTADERDRDYFGAAVNRVARLLGIAYGGQVLLSGVTSELVQGSLPPEGSLRTLGEHRLKDLSRPESVHQLLAPGLQAEFPQLRSLGALPNNLPPQLKSFVGRETEIAEITALIAQHRVVTLVGSGGIGKTRTSLQVAANLLDESSDGVWFVELAPLTNGEHIPSTIAQTMGLTLANDGNPVKNLGRALGTKHAVLLLDNCEHMVEAAAGVIAAIVRVCPRVRVLASSRQSLEIAGEATYRLPSLHAPLDADAASLSAADATRYAALELFADRARAADHRFALTDENAPVVADICRRLDGIALAIELAAARVKILSPRQLRDRLSERFRLLTGGNRDLLPRQQTLRALIDWSHDLLDGRERTLFRRAGIFVSGFTIEGAVAAGSDAELDEFDIFDVLASLVEKSLVLAEPGGDSVRYRLLESTRAYALEKLADARDHDHVAGHHLRYFRDRFSELNADFERTLRSSELIEAFVTELDDLRSALDGALARRDLHAGAELLAAIGRFWMVLGLNREGISRIEAFIEALPRSESILLATLSGALAPLLSESGKSKLAAVAAERGLAFARDSGDAATLAYALRWHYGAQMRVGNLEDANAALGEAEAIPGPSPRLRFVLLEARADFSLETGDLDAAAVAFRRMRFEQSARGDDRSANLYTLSLAAVDYQRGLAPSAIAIVREILPALRSGSEKLVLANALTNLANYLAASESCSEALVAAREVIAVLAPWEPDHFLLTLALEPVALVYAQQGDVRRAALLEGYADAAIAHIGYQRDFAEKVTYDRLAAVLGAKLPPDDFARLTGDGVSYSAEAAIALALA